MFPMNCLFLFFAFFNSGFSPPPQYLSFVSLFGYIFSLGCLGFFDIELYELFVYLGY